MKTRGPFLAEFIRFLTAFTTSTSYDLSSSCVLKTLKHLDSGSSRSWYGSTPETPVPCTRMDKQAPVSIGWARRQELAERRVGEIVWGSLWVPRLGLLVAFGVVPCFSCVLSSSLCWLGCPGCLFVFSLWSFRSGGGIPRTVSSSGNPSDVCRCIEEGDCDKYQSVSFVIWVTTSACTPSAGGCVLGLRFPCQNLRTTALSHNSDPMRLVTPSQRQ